MNKNMIKSLLKSPMLRSLGITVLLALPILAGINTGAFGTAGATTLADYYPINGCKLEIQKTVDETRAYDDDVLTYKITFKNIGTGRCTGGGVKIEDAIDPRITFVSESRSTNVMAGYGSTPLYSASTRILTWNADELSPGESGWVTWFGKVSGATCEEKDLKNQARISSYEYGWGWLYSNVVNTRISLQNCNDFNVACTVNPTSGFTNTTSFNYEATVAGPGTFTYSWSGDENLSGNTRQVSKFYQTAGTKQGTVAVTSNGTTKTATCYVQVEIPEIKECKLIISKAVNKKNAINGEEIIYRLEFKNIGNKNCTGGGVKIEDDVSDDLIFVRETHSSNVTPGYENTPLFNASNRTLTWNADVLLPGEEGWVKWTARIATVSCTAYNLKNVARISAHELGWRWIYSNEVSTSIVNDDCNPLITRCEATPHTGLIGETFTWKVFATGGTGSYTYNWNGTDGLSGSSNSIQKSYSTVGTKTGTVTTVSGNKSDTISCSITVTKPEEKFCKLEIVKSVDKTSAKSGEFLNYHVEFKNTGNKNCTGGGVKIEDHFDDRLEYVSSNHSSNVTNGYGSIPLYDHTNRRLTWNADTLTPGEEGWVTVKVRIPEVNSCSAIEMANTARISAYELGWQWVTSNTVRTSVTSEYCDNDFTATCAVSPSSGEIGTTFNYSANASGGTGSYTYSWTGSEGLSSSSRTVSKSYVSAGTKTGTVTVTSGNRSITRTCTVVVNDRPQITPPSVIPFCDVNTSKVRVSWSSLSRGQDGYHVDIDNDNNWSNGGWTLFVPSGTTVIETAGPFSPFGGTSGNLVIQQGNAYQIRVLYKWSGEYSPTVSFSFATCGGGGEFTLQCSVNPSNPRVNDVVSWNAHPSGGTGSYTYSWTGTDGLSGSSQNIGKAYHSEGQKSATVTVTSGNFVLSRTCVVNISHYNPPCSLNCPGGLNPPNVHLISKTKVEVRPLASGYVYLSQVPYTGLKEYSTGIAILFSLILTMLAIAGVYVWRNNPLRSAVAALGASAARFDFNAMKSVASEIKSGEYAAAAAYLKNDTGGNLPGERGEDAERISELWGSALVMGESPIDEATEAILEDEARNNHAILSADVSRKLLGYTKGDVGAAVELIRTACRVLNTKDSDSLVAISWPKIEDALRT